MSSLSLDPSIPPGPPSAPVLSISAKSPDSFTLSWIQLPTDIFEGYDISWTYLGPCDEEIPDGSMLLNSSSRAYTVTGLRANSQYLVTVAAVGTMLAYSQINVTTTADCKMMDLHPLSF